MTLKVGDVYPIEGGIVTGINAGGPPTVCVTGVLWVTQEQAREAEDYYWQNCGLDKDKELVRISRDVDGYNRCKILDANYHGEQDDGEQRQPEQRESATDTANGSAAAPAKPDDGAPDADKPAKRAGPKQRTAAKTKDAAAGGKPAPEKGKAKPAARVRAPKSARRPAKKKRKA